MLRKVVLVALVVLLVAMIIQSLPDIKRYREMRQM